MFDIKFSFKTIAKSTRQMTSLLLAGLVSVGSPLLAGEPVRIGAPVEARVSDVALHQGGIPHGTVLNAEAQPVAAVAVSVVHNESVVATTLSNEKGEFTVKGLRSGAHVIKAGPTQQAVRLWVGNASPPSAIEDMAIVVDEEAVRGKMFGGGGGTFGNFLGSKIGGLMLIGGATAITLGTTLANSPDIMNESKALLSP